MSHHSGVISYCSALAQYFCIMSISELARCSGSELVRCLGGLYFPTSFFFLGLFLQGLSELGWEERTTVIPIAVDDEAKWMDAGCLATWEHLVGGFRIATRYQDTMGNYLGA